MMESLFRCKPLGSFSFHQIDMNSKNAFQDRMMPKNRVVGKSIEVRDIVSEKIGGMRLPCALLLGGFHGDEPKSVRLVEAWREMFLAGAGTQLSNNVINGVRWILVPVVNPDGFASRKRRNARRVDINRNFPTKNWGGFKNENVATARPNKRSRMYGGPSPASEPETRAVIELIERVHPACIITVHSISGGRFCNNYDGPGRQLANAIARCNGYPVASTIGYPTPGSFGTWAGVERRIPTITLELPAEHSTARCLRDNRDVLGAVARFLRRRGNQ
jgi:protein MpaA